MDTSTNLDKEDASTPNYRGLFDTPASSAPVIISLTSEPKSFKLLTLHQKKLFISALLDAVGPVKSDTKWSSRGEAYIYPKWNRQKEKLLQLTIIGDFRVTCARAKSERETKGVIHIPVNNTEEEVALLLRDQNVTATKRFFKQTSEEEKVPIPTMTLFFSTPTIPREVIIAHEIFQVKKFIPRPTTCYNCWKLGHSEDNCRSATRCRRCGGPHTGDSNCQSPLVCPTCGKEGHIAGVPECPIYNNRQNVIRYAYENDISIAEAGRHLNGPTNKNAPAFHRPLTSSRPPSTDQTDETAKLREEIESIKTQLAAIQEQQASSTIPKIVEERFEKVEREIQTIQTTIKPLVNTAMEEGFHRIEQLITLKLRQFADMAQPTQGKSAARTTPLTEDVPTNSPKRSKIVSPPKNQAVPLPKTARQVSEPTPPVWRK